MVFACLSSNPDAKPKWLENRCLLDRKSTRLNSSHSQISYAVFCLKKKIKKIKHDNLHTFLLFDHSSLFLSFFFFFIIPLPPRSTLFPYTTLFRSRGDNNNTFPCLTFCNLIGDVRIHVWYLPAYLPTRMPNLSGWKTGVY